MAKVRMHSPPARTVYKTNKRWDRQRPVTRGGGSDHDAGAPATPTITGITPSSTTVAGPRAFTVAGTGFYAPAQVRYKAGADAETVAAANVVGPTSVNFTLPSGAVDTAGTITWSLEFGDLMDVTVTGTPNVTVA
jgi:hypothetical protein